MGTTATTTVRHLVLVPSLTAPPASLTADEMMADWA